MKKIFFNFCMLIHMTGLAQFSITEKNFPIVGAKEYRWHDTTRMSVSSAGFPGTGQSWDLSMLKKIESDTVFYLDPNTCPKNNLFPTSNLAIYSNFKGKIKPKGYVFANLNKDNFSVLGTYQENPGAPGSMINPVFSPVQRNFIFPSGYQTTFKDTQQFICNYKTTGFFDSISIHHRFYNTTTIDGYGSLITPSGFFKNVMRSKNLSQGSDSIFGGMKSGNNYVWNFIQVSKDTTTYYRWHSANYYFSLAELVFKGKNQVYADGSYLFNLPTPFDIRINQEPFSIIFTGEKIIIRKLMDKPCMIRIYDLNGRIRSSLVLKEMVNEFSSNNLDNGVYIYEITDGKNIMRGKFYVD